MKTLTTDQIGHVEDTLINHYGLKVHSLLKQTKVCLGGNTELSSFT